MITRRRLLLAAAPSTLLIGAGRGLMIAAQKSPGPSLAAPREIEGIYAPPPLHWVGDGFRVAGYFSQVPNAAERLSPFVLLDYHPPFNYPPTTRRRGVGVHPHRGIETVTFAWQGSVAHHDSTGAGGVIGPDDVQWMTAGGGILHKEYHEEAYARTGGPFHMAQLWVNLPRARKFAPPGYQPLESERMGIAALAGQGGELRVVAGEFEGVKGPAKTFTPIDVYDLRLNAGGEVQFSFPGHLTTALLVMSGAVSINRSTEVRSDDFVLFGRTGEIIALAASAPTHILVLNGEPIHEPVVAYGPFVMNTREEIEQAYADYRAGKFGHLED